MSRKLQYYDFNGYAEGIRYMLHYGGLSFEDVRYKGKDWPIKSVKDTLPYGQLPVYEEDGRVLNQSVAIARHVASQTGLLPSDPWDQARMDAAVLNIYDVINKLMAYIVDERKREENKKTVDDLIEFYYTRFEKELKDGNGYLAGKLSWADFILVSITELFNLKLKVELHKTYPTLGALMNEILSFPGIKEYLATRPEYS